MQRQTWTGGLRSPDNDGGGGGGGGGPQPTVEELMAANTAMANKNKELLADLKRTQERFKPFADKDPAKVQEALDAQAKADEERAKAAGNFDALRTQMAEQFNKTLADEKAATERYRKMLFEGERDRAAQAAIAAAKGNTKLLLPHVRDYIAVSEVDGRIHVEVKDPVTGQPKIGTKGEPMSVSDFVLALRADTEFESAFQAGGGSGTGGPRSTTAPGSGNIRLTREQAQDVGMYRRAREEAEKRGVEVEIG